MPSPGLQGRLHPHYSHRQIIRKKEDEGGHQWCGGSRLGNVSKEGRWVQAVCGEAREASKPRRVKGPRWEKKARRRWPGGNPESERPQEVEREKSVVGAQRGPPSQKGGDTRLSVQHSGDCRERSSDSGPAWITR